MHPTAASNKNRVSVEHAQQVKVSLPPIKAGAVKRLAPKLHEPKNEGDRSWDSTMTSSYQDSAIS